MNKARGLAVRIVVGVVAGWIGFRAIASITGWAVERAGGGSMSAGVRQAVMKGVLVVVSLAVWSLVRRRRLSEMGWRRPDSIGVWRLLSAYAVAAVSMGLASIAMILTDSHHPVVSGLSFFEVVLTIWIVSSIAEEIYVRGLVQSWIGDGDLSPARQRAVILASAGLFAALHVPLMWKGAGPLGGGIIVAATFGLGWAAASVRARTHSLWHAIGVHIFGNMAALPFGIIAVVAYRLIHGHMPMH